MPTDSDLVACCGDCRHGRPLEQWHESGRFPGGGKAPHCGSGTSGEVGGTSSPSSSSSHGEDCGGSPPGRSLENGAAQRRQHTPRRFVCIVPGYRCALLLSPAPRHRSKAVRAPFVCGFGAWARRSPGPAACPPSSRASIAPLPVPTSRRPGRCRSRSAHPRRSESPGAQKFSAASSVGHLGTPSPMGPLFALNRIVQGELLELQRVLVQHSQQVVKNRS